MKKTVATIAILVLSLAVKSTLCAQVLEDSATFKMLCKGVDYIYNCQFNRARDIYKKLIITYPGYPMNYVYHGLITYWENYPLLPSSAAHASFEKDMEYAIELCEKEPHPKYEAEFLLSNIGARGMLLLYYADNDMSMDVFSLASSTYQCVKQSFHYTSIYPDFYFITGLYNYYREAYPDAHPVYKPLALLFPKGDKVKGLKEMQIAAKNAIVLKAEAYSFLAGIYISFENNFPQAYQYSKALHELYPLNTQYLAVYIKNLLLVKKYGEAESLIKSGLQQGKNAYFLAQLSLLNGIVQEKKYRNLKLAQALYTKGIKDISPFGSFGNEYKAYGYFGLSRISEANGDKHYKKLYRKQAMDLADYKKVNFDE